MKKSSYTSGKYFHGASYNPLDFGVKIDNKCRIVTDFEPVLDVQGQDIIPIQLNAQNPGSYTTTISVSIQLHSSTRFWLQSKKFGSSGSNSDCPYKLREIPYTDPNMFNRLLHLEIFYDRFILDEYTTYYERMNRARDNINAYNFNYANIQKDTLGVGSKFYAIQVYDKNDNLIELIYPAYDKTNDRKGFYSFAGHSFIYNYTNMDGQNNIGLGPVVPYV